MRAACLLVSVPRSFELAPGMLAATDDFVLARLS
jgi:hypothetical protein